MADLMALATKRDEQSVVVVPGLLEHTGCFEPMILTMMNLKAVGPLTISASKAVATQDRVTLDLPFGPLQ